MDYKKLLIVAIAIYLVYVIYEYFLSKHSTTMMPSMGSDGTLQIKYAQPYIYNYPPVYTYSGYYFDHTNPVQSKASMCIPPPSLTTSCVNQRMIDTNGDLSASVTQCNNPNASFGSCSNQMLRNTAYYPVQSFHMYPYFDGDVPAEVELTDRPMVNYEKVVG